MKVTVPPSIQTATARSAVVLPRYTPVSATDFPTSARAVHTAQLYLFPDENRSLATEGVEGNVPVLRAVTGGTGRFSGYVGEQRQELRFNATGGVNLRVTFILKKRAAEAHGFNGVGRSPQWSRRASQRGDNHDDQLLGGSAYRGPGVGHWPVRYFDGARQTRKARS